MAIATAIVHPATEKNKFFVFFPEKSKKIPKKVLTFLAINDIIL